MKTSAIGPLGMFQVLNHEGTVVGPLPDVDDAALVEMHRLMVFSRAIDRKAYQAQRQGRIGTYPMIEGHEAAQIGSGRAFGDRDFLYPGYRELGIQIARGMPLDVLLAYWKGLPNDRWKPYDFGMMSISVPIGSHLPHAVGHAHQSRRMGDAIVTGAFIGDGGTSENDFHSGLNFAGVWKTPTVFICQNNAYAISVPYEKQTASETIAEKAAAYGMPGVRVDGMDVLAVYSATKDAVERARRGEGPTLIEAVCYRYGAHATADDARLYRSGDEEEQWRTRDPLVRMGCFLKDRGLWDDASSESVISDAESVFEATLAELEASQPPPDTDLVRHAFERIPRLMIDQVSSLDRSRGTAAESIDATRLWSLRDDPVVDGPTESMTMADAINLALHEEMERDQSIIILGEDVAVAGGDFRITAGLLDVFGPERVIDTPLNESGIVGAAIGMAIAGGRPIAEIQFDGFIYPAFDQIVSHLGRIRYRTRGHVSVPVVVRFPSGAGIRAHEHHCDSPEAYLMHAPGLVVVTPSNPYDAKGLMTSAIRTNDPVLFLEPKSLYRAGRQEVPTNSYEIPLGKARRVVFGDQATVVSYGNMTPKCATAAERLASSGIHVEVIDLRTIYPWDVEMLVESVRRTGRFLFVQETKRTAGVGAEIAAEIGQRCGWDLDAPIRRMAATDAPWPQFAIESQALVTSEMIEAEIRSLVSE